MSSPPRTPNNPYAHTARRLSRRASTQKLAVKEPSLSDSQPSKSDVDVWGNIGSPPALHESPFGSSLLCLSLFGLMATTGLFGLLVYSGPWCNCGRHCMVPAVIQHAVTPLCNNKDSLQHGETCDIECNAGYISTSEEFLCVDSQLAPSSVSCVPVDAGGYVARQAFGGVGGFSRSSVLGALAFGCQPNTALPIVGTCFDECQTAEGDPVDDVNVWSISTLRIGDAWRPPDQACCKVLHEACKVVNSKIAFRQFIATSTSSGICNLACVPLPPDAIQYANELLVESVQTNAPQVAQEVVADVTTTPSPKDQLANLLQSMNDDGATTTPAPVNQTEYWIEYDRNNKPIAGANTGESSVVNILAPECFLGVLLSPMCFFFLALFFILGLMVLCVAFRMWQQTMRDRWPGNDTVGAQVFQRCAANVEPYHHPAPKVGPGGKLLEKPSELRRVASSTLRGFGKYETKVSTASPQLTFTSNSSETQLQLSSSHVARIPVDRSKPLMNVQRSASDESDVFRYLGNDTVMDCGKRHGLVVSHDERLHCPQCDYSVVRYVPYKTHLEVIDFYVCHSCKYEICHLCAGQQYNRVHIRGKGVIGVAKEED